MRRERLAPRSLQRGLISPALLGVASARRRVSDTSALSLYNAFVGDARGSYWEFEENDAGTTYSDSTVNANHLTVRTGGSTTATSSVTGTGTPSGSGRFFSPNDIEDRTAYIPRSNTNLDLPNADWTMGGWFKENDTTGGSARYFIGRLGAYSASKMQADVWSSSVDGHYNFQISSDGNGQASNADSGIKCTAVRWQFVTATLDRANNLIRLRVKDTGGSNANVTAAFAGALFTTASNSNFCISDILNNDSTFSVSGSRQIAAADQCFFVSKAISDSEFDYLYNSGSGKTWAQILADSGH